MAFGTLPTIPVLTWTYPCDIMELIDNTIRRIEVKQNISSILMDTDCWPDKSTDKSSLLSYCQE